MFLSQNGIAIKHAAPTTIMEIRLGLFQPALAAIVNGIKISVNDTQIRSRPKKSNSNQRVLMISHHDSPENGEVGRIPRIAALRWLITSASANGKKATGSTTAQIP